MSYVAGAQAQAKKFANQIMILRTSRKSVTTLRTLVAALATWQRASTSVRTMR